MRRPSRTSPAPRLKQPGFTPGLRLGASMKRSGAAAGRAACREPAEAGEAERGTMPRLRVKMEAPMRQQGENAASIPNIPGPVIEATRIHPRLAPGGFHGRGFPGLRQEVNACIHSCMPPHFSPDPLAYFLTWTTYGSWLPGDARGWTDHYGQVRAADPGLARLAARWMPSAAITLKASERNVVEATIRRHCHHREWHLHAVACRSQHVHVVVTAPGMSAKSVLAQFKAWCTVDLTRARTTVGGAVRQQQWTRGGSCRVVYDEQSLVDTTTYVRVCQDRPRA